MSAAAVAVSPRSTGRRSGSARIAWRLPPAESASGRRWPAGRPSAARAAEVALRTDLARRRVAADCLGLNVGWRRPDESL